MRAFIIFRDRVTYGKRCLTALLAAGLEPVIIDHGSTWPEAVAWLASLEKSGVMVLRRDGGHPRGIWGWGMFRAACGNDRYIVTDPDVVPSENCPGDWVQHLSGILDHAPRYCHKVGFGLRLDRIPEHSLRREQVLRVEEAYWKRELVPGVFDAPIDTTLALHVPQAECGCHSFEAQRTGYPYVADHLAWYESGNREELPEEIAWYYEHAEPGITHWAPGEHSAWKDA